MALVMSQPEQPVAPTDPETLARNKSLLEYVLLLQFRTLVGIPIAWSLRKAKHSMSFHVLHELEIPGQLRLLEMALVSAHLFRCPFEMACLQSDLAHSHPLLMRATSPIHTEIRSCSLQAALET